MATVIKLANFIQKYNDKDDVKEFISSLGDSWKNFVDNELKKSNDTNNKSLGG